MNMTETESEQKPRRGPPAWHSVAKEMREQGFTYAEIGKRLGYSAPAVYFALHPHKRWYKKDKGALAPFPAVTPPPADL